MLCMGIISKNQGKLWHIKSNLFKTIQEKTMDLKQVMAQKSFAVLGDTLNEEKYAYKIKQGLLEKGYTVYCVGKELASINDIEGEIDIIDLCIHPAKGLKLLQECKKNYQFIVIQPGAGDEALLAYLNQQNIPYMDGCLLVGLKLYA